MNTIHKIVIQILLVLSFTLVSYPQSLKIKMGGNYNLLIKGSETFFEGKHYEITVDDISFGTFYKSAPGFLFDVRFFFWTHPEEFTNGFFFIGMSYEKVKILAKDTPAKIVLGETISQHKFTPYIAYGDYLDANSYFYSVFLGVSMKNYSGEGTVILSDSLSNTYTGFGSYEYTDVLALRLGVGLDIENLIESSFFLSLNSYYEWGVARRGKLTVNILDERLEFNPVGQLDIFEKTLNLSFSIGYRLNF